MSQTVPKVDYSKSLIYKIVCNDNNIKNIYIGSSTNFKNRKYHHKSNCYNENDKEHYDLYVYKFIRENGGWENWSMILVNYVPCKTKLELLKIEREYIETIDNDLLLNRNIPSRSSKEYNRQYNKQYNKQYRENNKEKIKEKQKEHYELNKEKRLNHVKEYREVNKEKIKEKNKEKVKCDICNTIVCKIVLTRHKKSKKCLNYSA